MKVAIAMFIVLVAAGALLLSGPGASAETAGLAKAQCCPCCEPGCPCCVDGCCCSEAGCCCDCCETCCGGACDAPCCEANGCADAQSVQPAAQQDEGKPCGGCASSCAG